MRRRPLAPPPSRRRRRLGRLGAGVAVAAGLWLGFLAGIELARAGRAPTPKPRPAEAAVARTAAAEARPAVAEALRTESSGALPGGAAATETRAVDPGAWLARFGEVEARPRGAAR